MNDFELADQVALAINSAPTGTFSRTFVSRVDIPISQELADIKDLQVLVLPMEDATQPATRTQDDITVEIGIGIQQKVTNPQEEVRELHTLVQAIRTYLNRRNFTDWVYRGSQLRPVLDAQHLSANRVFTSLIRITYTTVAKA